MMLPNNEDLLRIADVVASGALGTTIERTYPRDGVPAALRPLDGVEQQWKPEPQLGNVPGTRTDVDGWNELFNTVLGEDRAPS
jgi:hypothetical protein